MNSFNIWPAGNFAELSAAPFGYPPLSPLELGCFCSPPSYPPPEAFSGCLAGSGSVAPGLSYRLLWSTAGASLCTAPAAPLSPDLKTGGNCKRYWFSHFFKNHFAYWIFRPIWLSSASKCRRNVAGRAWGHRRTEVRRSGTFLSN